MIPVRRIFWMAVGAGATVWTINKANQVARSLTPGSLADSAARGAADLGAAARSFAGEVRAGMLQRELELNRELGLDGSVLAAPGGSAGPLLRGRAQDARTPLTSAGKPVELTAPVHHTSDITPYTAPYDRNEDSHGVG
ncbi:hypothetical protein GXW83_12370 [Streptacidiphilus sp. PB12-B1b]|uniref:hypothetical protein n=1 Tax=Streptacidiphilus sp. PB12-B1b TaxID=2705012 RepID=UPI0015FDCD3B|nr:hypothetical protein [Streptacidiphilus sp. PB12-B1b]QMU76415.1 hypothetical protein GXW83_12370 [Streptacidiphilus sp. PB12-B1b]